MTLREYYNLYPIAANRKEIDERLKSLKRPAYIAGRVIEDKTLNLLTLGEYALLSSVKTDAEFITAVCQVLHLSDLYSERAENALGLLDWVAKGVQRIGKMFEKAGKQVPASTEELAAGVKELPSDIFTLIDWFARRMYITHDVAENTTWQIVYKCFDNDMKQAAYERRLRYQYQKKQNARRKRK